MGLTHVTVSLKAFPVATEAYEARFLVDTGSMDCMVSARELHRIGVTSMGRRMYELADGTRREYDFGPAQIEFLGEVTFGAVIFGPDNAEPILGVTGLESAGFAVDPTTQALRRVPAVALKTAVHLREARCPWPVC